MITSHRKQDLKLFRKHTHSKGKKIKPGKILNDFFTDFTLEDAKEDLWELIKAAMGDRTGTHEEVTHFFFVYERLNDMLTAAYLVARKRHFKGLQASSKKTL